MRARLHAQQQTALGWRCRVGVPLYRNVDEEGTAEAAEYLVWVTPGIHVQRIEGEDYSGVPTAPLRSAPAEPDLRWAWTVERRRLDGGRFELVVHTYDCAEAPAGGEELNIDQALNALERPGARACRVCDAAASLLPLLDDRPDTNDL
ncbi:DUF6233 domain-containing protein [Streptomyces cavernicola]|uniref:DUF6233 domain-containing protein n=1 Tax=Streptomyces cavernicola TaxID=3043613 RepID=A0ABT6SJC5_9ACTN|nr:DUF6233 domain-containing protein [Streptomyces sp. B-S-A6]MDI3408305.1 DUF6233 domain-containing protein [Streptomyces sp. B-S-A6]